MLILFLILLIIEFFVINSKRNVIYLAPFLNILILVVFVIYFLLSFNFIYGIVFAYFASFKIINGLRIKNHEKNPVYVRRIMKRSTLILDSYLLLVWTIASLLTSANSLASAYILLSISTIFLVYVIYRVENIKSKITNEDSKLMLTDKELPTISVLIPARNETDDLIRCLDCVLSSDYSKMEVIVLDDCSTNKQTPKIIKSYAQSGVRFISGQKPPTEWNAKNYAYQQLAEQASGDYLIFLGVDVIVGVNTLRDVIANLVKNDKLMLSILPINKIDNFDIKYYLIQPMRYLIDLIVPNKLFKSMTAISTFWAVKKDNFLDIGGFKAVKGTVTPEKYFARIFNGLGSYVFIPASLDLELRSSKVFVEQKDTAIRLIYPTFRKRLEYISIFSLVLIITLIAPLVSLIFSIINSNIYLFVFSIISILSCIIAFNLTYSLTYRKNFKFNLLMYPFSLSYTIYISLLSMYRYEFGQVLWKDRNVCIPVMRQYTPQE